MKEVHDGFPAELLNRGNNLFPIGLLAALGASEATAIPLEGHIISSIDQAVLALLGLVAIIWYLRGRFQRSIVPGILLGIAVASQIFALIVEEPDDRGNDIGVGLVVLVATITWIVIYLRTGKADTSV